jgi:hypothetical protein
LTHLRNDHGTVPPQLKLVGEFDLSGYNHLNSIADTEAVGWVNGT